MCLWQLCRAQTGPGARTRSTAVAEDGRTSNSCRKRSRLMREGAGMRQTLWSRGDAGFCTKWCARWLVRALCVLLNVCSGRSNALETGARAWKAGGKGDTQ